MRPHALASSYQFSTQKYLQLANSSNEMDKTRYLLLAAGRALQDKQLARSQDIMQQIENRPLSAQQELQMEIIRARLALANQQPKKAIQQLKLALSGGAMLDRQTQATLLKLINQAYIDNADILNAINTSSEVYRVMDDRAKKQAYLFRFWQQLQKLDRTQLASLANQANDDNQKGWIALLQITRRNANAKQMPGKIKTWQQKYPGNLAQVLLRSESMRQLMIPNQPKNIALLLPLNGALAKQGQAIRNGFLAAYYQEKTQGYSPDVNVIDTSQADIRTLYQKALNEGANLVIGPLVKSNIEKLVNQVSLSVPTIALNTIPNNKSISNLFQFGLSPDDEAVQVAQKIWSDQHQRLLVIMPDNSWGERIFKAFSPDWLNQGGEITDTLRYTTRAKLAKQLRSLFNLDQSSHRALTMRWLLREKLRHIPRRRQDFDAIFLIANPSMGRQILPLLKFYYLNNTPVYSISQIYQASATAKLDHDINGVLFDDIPWQFNDKLPSWIQSIKTSAQTAWPKSFKHYSRLYALGTDAYNLIPELNKLALLPQFSMDGATGVLYLQPNGQIYRELIWAKMQAGKALPLS